MIRVLEGGSLLDMDLKVETSKGANEDVKANVEGRTVWLVSRLGESPSTGDDLEIEF